jgi:hypothetical protein
MLQPLKQQNLHRISKELGYIFVQKNIIKAALFENVRKKDPK